MASESDSSIESNNHMQQEAMGVEDVNNETSNVHIGTDNGSSIESLMRNDAVPGPSNQNRQEINNNPLQETQFIFY